MNESVSVVFIWEGVVVEDAVAIISYENMSFIFWFGGRHTLSRQVNLLCKLPPLT